MDPAREKRKEDIIKALAFIQSSVAYPEPDGYQDFLTQLVCNLLDEGNAFFRDGQLEQAVREFSEGLNVSCYAEGEEITISEVLLESLYVNRAAAYHSMGEYEQGLLDCSRALEVCKDSRRALYRKALCLKELGKHKEAYDCTASCMLINPQDKQVNELAQELAVHLGLKIRKPYVSAKMSAGNTQKDNGITPVGLLGMLQSSFPSSPSGCSTPADSATPEKVDTTEDSELMGDDIDSLLDCVSTEPDTSEAVFSVPSRTSTCTQTVPAVLPAPTPQLPPAFFNSAINQLNSLDGFSGGRLSTSASTLDILDDLSTSGNGANASNLLLTSTELDGLDSLDDVLAKTPRAAAAAAEEVIEAKTELDAGEKSLDELLDELDPSVTLSDPSSQGGRVSKIRTKSVDRLDSLDSLDSFSSVDGVRVASPAFSCGGVGLDSLSDFNSTASHSAAAPGMRSAKNHYKEKENQALVSNPLSFTHEFLQACSACYPREGLGIYTYVHKADLAHNCKRDVLLCRRKAEPPSEWTRVRQLPILRSFGGRFVLCRELLKSGELGVCKYGEKCTFAYNQLEIDVWTEERKGKLDRNLLFGTRPVKLDPVSSIIRLLQEDKGSFMLLCQECYDSKPRIISKRCRDNQTICSNLDVHHNFDANKCLAFVVRTHSVNYRKVRPLSVMCHMDLCRQAIRYGCLREDDCHYAHSVIELKTWKVQRDTGVSPEEIVRISTKYHDKQEQNSSKQKGNRQLSSGGGGSKPGGGVGGAGKSLNMRMKFACGQCWLDGLISEPDKTLKYCGAKARHAWTKDRRVLLVKSSERSKWVQVRPLPHAKDFPAQYCMCAQILEKKKCTYSGVCTFAHSPEEKDMWMYMKNNDLRDMQQMYDMWMILSGRNRQADGAMAAQPIPEDKCITMPTDYAEPMSGFHCRLCGKHSNSERQWQQHISTEKHKDRVFSCEGDEALTWSYRFPGTRFELCSKVDGSCPDGVSCDYAHSPEELQEWMERRDFLRQKLAKAREDMLIMPDEVDFGKYNFLLQD